VRGRYCNSEACGGGFKDRSQNFADRVPSIRIRIRFVNSLTSVASLLRLLEIMAGTGTWARVYADVNAHKPRDYWDYESHPIEWG